MVLCNFLRRPIHYQDFGIVENTVSWAYGMCNLLKLLRNPANWENYEINIYEFALRLNS
jgi:hypothetical protein